MSKKSMAKDSLSPDSARMLRELGERIRFARKRRGMTISDLAARMMSSPATVQRLEKADPGISLGVLMSALLCLGLEKDIASVAAMETDFRGLAYDRRRLLKRKQGHDMTPEESFFKS
ncbi:MAG: helix-turn-helix domain-containing protein [Desulfobulbus sp.]|nr:helix-turn-helix domain-containing protein [Desulfobulbus sp.]